ncbi:MAG TPA: orotidine-5'-phosphate decarboxylase, partial [Candidatus Paceibacterota bacterium]|nr:orotidine-5'-phosphate decarboxylase [Candidatus Paceibacterota bacterium]
IKINSALRTCGYDLINMLHDLGVEVMADLKLNDISNTMATDAEILTEFKPKLLTVMCSTGIEGMSQVQKTLDGITEVLGVTVLTSLDRGSCQDIYGCPPAEGVIRFAQMAKVAKLGGLVLSGQEVAIVKDQRGLKNLSLNVPGIRPTWSIISGDDQKRIMTPKEAILAGANRIVVGRPILTAGPNEGFFPDSPLEAVKWTLAEIEEALASMTTT